MRTFIALELPEAIQLQIKEQQQRLQERLRQAHLARTVRWSAAQNVHVTLHFLGDTTDEQAHAVESALQRTLADSPPFDLTLAELGCFPNLRRPRVLWIGLSGDLQPLQSAQARIEQIVQDVGFAAEGRAFSPHITLGRVQRNADRRDVRRLGDVLQDEAAQFEAQRESEAFRAERIVFFRSELRPGGSVYTPLAHVTLG